MFPQNMAVQLHLSKIKGLTPTFLSPLDEKWIQSSQMRVPKSTSSGAWAKRSQTQGGHEVQFFFVKEDISFLEDYKLNDGCDPCVVNILSKKLWNMQLWSILDFKVAMLAWKLQYCSLSTLCSFFERIIISLYIFIMIRVSQSSDWPNDCDGKPFTSRVI